MFIPGFLITWLTFPGVMVHELGHQLCCHLTNTRVISVCYFRFGNPAGYVIHGRPSNVWKQLLIGFGPLIFNTLFGFVLGLGLVATRHRWEHQHNGTYLAFFWSWLSVSIAMHSFPSTGDAETIWKSIWDKRAPFLVWLVGLPLVGIIYLGALGSVFWLDLIYGVAIAWILPQYCVG